MTTCDLFQIDAFTDRPFSGNPAAVCLLADAADERWMQRLAAEMNLSETAFVVPRNGGYDLRWFTPLIEVELCGHATLASAHVLWQTGIASPEQSIQFHTRSGMLTCRREGSWISMDFPAKPVAPCSASKGLLEALGVHAEFVGRNNLDYLVQVSSEDPVRGLKPNLAELSRIDARAVIVTAVSADPAFDFVSRFFAPGVGIDEDPVTGSAHCALAPFWATRLGRQDMTGRQLSSRGGVVRVLNRGPRVTLAGQAVTIFRGSFDTSAAAPMLVHR